MFKRRRISFRCFECNFISQSVFQSIKLIFPIFICSDWFWSSIRIRQSYQYITKRFFIIICILNTIFIYIFPYVISDFISFFRRQVTLSLTWTCRESNCIIIGCCSKLTSILIYSRLHCHSLLYSRVIILIRVIFTNNFNNIWWIYITKINIHIIIIS